MKGRLSVGTRLGTTRVAVDYAFLPEAYTPGETHRVTLTIHF